jgi:hypothetical protein
MESLTSRHFRARGRRNSVIGALGDMPAIGTTTI